MAWTAPLAKPRWTTSDGERLAAQFSSTGHTPLSAAVAAELNPGEVDAWVATADRGPRHAPGGERLVKALHSLGLPIDGWEPYIVAATSELIAVCRLKISEKCTPTRTIRRGRLTGLLRFWRDRRRAPRTARIGAPTVRADGQVVVDVPCAACSRREHVKDAISRRWETMRNAPWWTTFTPDGLKRFKEAKRGAPGVAKAAEHRNVLSLAHVLLAKLTHPISACPLCELWIYQRRWHKICALRWKHYRLRHPEAPTEPPASSRRGPSGTNALRDFRFLLRRIAGESRSELAKNSVFAPHAGLSRRREAARAAVNSAIKRFIKRLPGAWRFVFTAGSGPRHKRESESQHTARWRKKNERKRDAFQTLVASDARLRPRALALPALIQQYVDSGQRNPLIRRLHHYEMPPKEIAELVGASLKHVKAVIADMATDEVARERMRGYRRRGVAARIDVTREKPVPRSAHQPQTRRKLTPSQVQAIVDAPAERGVIGRLAEEHNLSPAWVSKIRRGHTVWSTELTGAPQAADMTMR